jgi:hypothetical protein
MFFEMARFDPEPNQPILFSIPDQRVTLHQVVSVKAMALAVAFSRTVAQPRVGYRSRTFE